MTKHQELVENLEEVRDLKRIPDAGAPSLGTYGKYKDDDGGVHLRDYWRSVRKHLWLVIGITAIITTLTAIYMARRPNIYTATSRVQVDLERVNPALGASKDSPIILNNTTTDPAYFNTQLQILTGPGLLRRVVRTLDLEHNPAFIRAQSASSQSTLQNLLRAVGLSRKKEADAKNQVANDVPLVTTTTTTTSSDDIVEAKRLSPYVDELLVNLKVDPVRETRLSIRDTRLIDISYTDTDPQTAAKIVNAVADTFVRTNLERKTESSNMTGDYLQKRIAELQDKIRTGGERLNNYAKSKEILTLDDKQNTVVDRLAGLNKQLLEAENTRKEAEAAYKAALEPGAANALAEDVTKQVNELEIKLADLRSKRAQLLVDNTQEWPEVKEVTEQIGVLEKQTRDIRNRAANVVVTNLKTRYQQALTQEQALRSAFEQQRNETLIQNEAAVNYRIIQQEIDTNKELLTGMLQRARENEVVFAGTQNNIHVVDYAIAPDIPIGPRRLMTMALAFLMSLSLGVGLALFLEYLDDTVRSASDVETILHLPALAVIPSVGGGPRRRLLPEIGSSTSRNGNGHGNTELLINTDPRSTLAEAYRQLRTSVLLSTAGRAPKTLLVTSSVPSEGKTTTAANTAISLAQTGARVLIVDVDMRRPRLHSIFELENRRGLSTILSSNSSEAEMLSMIHRHEASGLEVLTSGPIPPNPAELIGSDQMRRLIATLESNFTHIIIDSPPIASFTDGVLVASMVDGVLLIVHGSKTSRNLVRRSRQLLQDVGAKIFGVVLNNVDLQRHDYYYYHSYYHQSYYAKSEDPQLVSSKSD